MMAEGAEVRTTPGRSLPWRILLYAVLGFWSLVCLFPVYWLVIVSLTASADIDHGPHYLPFIDFWPSLEAWRFILADPYENLLMRFVNSAVIAASSSILAVLTGCMVVYGLTRFRLSWSMGHRWLLPACDLHGDDGALCRINVCSGHRRHHRGCVPLDGIGGAGLGAAA